MQPFDIDRDDGRSATFRGDQQSYRRGSDASRNGYSSLLSNRNNLQERMRGRRIVETESHQYEQEESDIWWHHQLQRYFEDKGQWWTFARKTDLLRWSLTFTTGFFCAIVALGVTAATKLVTNYKYNTFHELLVYEKERSLPFGTAFAFLFLCNVVFGFLAWLAVFVEPLAGGSGIPEIKCYLNGLDIPQLVSFRTLVCKAIGIVFACAAGLPLGKEGPMVHIGAVIAAGISQGEGFTCGVDTTFSRFQDLRNDREKRDFVACGAAAGVAAAFGAPIGGVLFSLEEGASFWSTKLTWRCFFCAMTTVFFLYVFDTAHSLFGHSDTTAMFSFGEFFSLQGEETNYSMWELSLFLFVGCFGGFVGACFNTIVHQIHTFRTRYVVSIYRRLLEVMAIVVLMTATSTLLPYLWKKCTPLPVDMEGWSDQEKNLVEDLVPLYCDGETEYNELASLYLADSDRAIRQLFHFREVGDHNVSTFSSAALFMFFVPYLAMACVTYGTAVPAGMFVPSLLSGAALGRLVGHLLHKLDNAHGTFADSGTYALLGAASVTSGIARMTISLTVMILEATGDMQYVLPLMLTVLSARLVGNFFTEGLYDSHIHFKRLPFLDEDDNMPVILASQELHEISVAEIMTKRVVTMTPQMTVGDVWDILQEHRPASGSGGGSGGSGSSRRHHCFPVVDDEDDDVLLGTITRKVLCALLKHKAFLTRGPASKHSPSGHSSSSGAGPAPAPGSGSGSGSGGTRYKDAPWATDNDDEAAAAAAAASMAPLLSWGSIEHVYPQYPDVEDLRVSTVERSYWLDLAPYMDTAPYIIHENTSIQRTYRMFRTLGLRHLVVTDRHHHVVGIVTRSDLMVTRQDLDSHRSLQSGGLDGYGGSYKTPRGGKDPATRPTASASGSRAAYDEALPSPSPEDGEDGEDGEDHEAAVSTTDRVTDTLVDLS